MNPTTTTTEGDLFDQKIIVAAESISSDWFTIKEFFKEIDPPFKRKDVFLARMERGRGKEKDVDDLAKCLRTWITENSDQDFLCAVYDAFNNYELASKLWKQFSDLRSKANA